MSIGVMLFNPFTGQPRHPSDIKSDPQGVLIWDGKETLKAAAASQPAQEPVECLDCGSHNVGIPATYDSLINSVKALNT